MTKDKNIILIGATGGIGRVISKSLIEANANVIISSRNQDKLEQLSNELGKERTIPIAADASNLEDVENLFEKARENLGTIDAVIIAAGTWKQLSIDEPTPEAIDLAKSHFNALFLPSFTVGYVAQKFMREQGHGLIVNISSHAAFRPELTGNLTYGPMKAASRHFMLALRKELGGTKVRVTDIEPAIVNTPDSAGLLNTEEKRAKAVQPESIAQWIIEHLEDDDIPPTVVFDSEVII